MRYRYLLLLTATLVLFSCEKDKGTTDPSPNPPPVLPVQPVLLKDLVLSNLPSPYYHFEYDPAGKPSFVSFASDFFRYDIAYSGDRISELKNNILVNKDRLQYYYDNAGRVNMIRYADSTGIVFQRNYFTYDGQKLIKMERERKFGSVFMIDKTMTFSYHADGNLLEIKEHRPAIGVQTETTSFSRFEQYDNKINTDGFSLIHNEFFEHVALLPGVQLQKNNPGKVTRTGDGVNYQVNYNYIYNDRNAPLEKRGEFTFLNGSDAGQIIHISSVFSYYE